MHPSPDSRSPRVRALWLGLVVTVALVVGACGGGDSETAAGEGGSTEAPADETPTLFSFEFDTVCRGVGMDGAATYVEGDGRPLILGFSGEAPEYSRTISFPDGWEPELEEVADTELVVCMDRVATVSDGVCEGYEDEDSGLAWSVEPFSATYEVAVRDAATAAIVEETTIEAASDGCPMFSFFSEGDPVPKPSYPLADDQLEAFLAPYMAA